MFSFRNMWRNWGRFKQIRLFGSWLSNLPIERTLRGKIEFIAYQFKNLLYSGFYWITILNWLDLIKKYHFLWKIQRHWWLISYQLYQRNARSCQLMLKKPWAVEQNITHSVFMFCSSAHAILENELMATGLALSYTVICLFLAKFWICHESDSPAKEE